MLRALPLIALTALTAEGGGFAETIEVDQTIERNVGFAIGVACDAPDVVAAGMKTVDNANIVVFTGLRVGTTLCRVGTDPYRISFLFSITVIEKSR